MWPVSHLKGVDQKKAIHSSSFKCADGVDIGGGQVTAFKLSHCADPPKGDD